jgi:ribosomal protein S18 acetylase RimI-like enzyme
MIEIREATPADAPAIVRLIRQLAEAVGETSPISVVFVKQYLASPHSRVLLAMDEGRVSGLLSYSLRPDLYHAGLCCMIEELVVAKQLRGQGTGGMLVDALIAQGETEGWAEVSVSVMKGNVRAQAFYKRHGLVDEALLLERHLGEATF